MGFVEGEKSEKICPKCGASLYYETTFMDCFSYKTGHYTVDVLILACEKCDYSEEIEESDSGVND